MSYVLGLGYRSAEFELYDVAFADRVQRLELVVERLRQAFDGTVTPPPFTTGGPSLAGGGGTVAAARRAARTWGSGSWPNATTTRWRSRTAAACIANSREPGSYFGPGARCPDRGRGRRRCRTGLA